MESLIKRIEMLKPKLKHKTGAGYIVWLMRHPNRTFAYFILEIVLNDIHTDIRSICYQEYFIYTDKYKYLNMPLKCQIQKQ